MSRASLRHGLPYGWWKIDSRIMVTNATIVALALVWAALCYIWFGV